jgi:1,5-anhydro-D-fructose reductase (1,5-anhydro-D-mannitol-forming)
MRYRTGFERLRAAVRDGRLGKPYHFWRQRFGSGPGATGQITERNWRTDPSFVVGMTVESFSHDADLLRWIMDDDVESVSAIVYGTVKDLPAFDNNAYALFRMKSGASATITASWSSRISFNDCGVLGESGTAFVSGSAPGNNGIWCSREYHEKTDNDAYERVDMIHDDLDETSYIRETNDFAEAIRTRMPPRAGIADGYKTLVISSAVLESARTGAPVHLP